MEELRLKAMADYATGKASMSDICREHGISRKTAYKWYKRYVDQGVDGLKDLSKAPHNPIRCYTTDQMDRAIDLKLRRRTWGPKKILAKLREHYPNEKWPCQTRLYEIFKEHNLVTSKRVRNRVPATAPLNGFVDCNDTWAIDLKGWFTTKDGSRCEPLTITDSTSRYLIRCTYLARHTAEYVWPILDGAFREYGLPNRIRSDNGPPFGCVGAGRLTLLSVYLIKAGVIPEWIRPGHPEENGRHERFHLTLKQEVATPPKDTLALQIQTMDEFYNEYNFERPHEALGMRTPGSCYTSSNRKWDGILRSPEYDSGWIVRKVGANGGIWLSQQEYYIAGALTGEYVGLKINEIGETEIYYGPVYLGILTNKGLDKPKLKGRRSR